MGAKIKAKRGLPSTTFLQKSGAGFTLIELLIVIAIIAILASVIFVALNPLKRFRDSRDAVRYEDVRNIMDAISLYQIDNDGQSLEAINELADNIVYMIVDGNSSAAMSNGCDDNDTICDSNVHSDASCVDLDGLVDSGYLADIPVSPVGDVTWDDGDTNGDEGTGYTLMTSSSGAILIQACESEDADEIKILR
jgi:prepilin-type N-terminal cleavage/methylation domain-containing protein